MCVSSSELRQKYIFRFQKSFFEAFRHQDNVTVWKCKLHFEFNRFREDFSVTVIEKLHMSIVHRRLHINVNPSLLQVKNHAETKRTPYTECKQIYIKWLGVSRWRKVGDLQQLLFISQGFRHLIKLFV